MKLLSRTEEILLVSIVKLGDSAYGVMIKDQVSIDTGYEWPYGAVYVPLKQLHNRRFVSKRKGKSTPERGGKRKIYYRITNQGLSALREINTINEKVWNGVDLPQ